MSPPSPHTAGARFVVGPHATSGPGNHVGPPPCLSRASPSSSTPASLEDISLFRGFCFKVSRGSTGRDKWYPSGRDQSINYVQLRRHVPRSRRNSPTRRDRFSRWAQKEIGHHAFLRYLFCFDDTSRTGGKAIYACHLGVICLDGEFDAHR